VVAEMKRELEDSGEEALRSDRLTFAHLAELYLEARVKPPVFKNGIKVSGIKSRISAMVTAATDHFGKKLIRSIRPRDLEHYKTMRLNTPVSKMVVTKRTRELNPLTKRLKTVKVKSERQTERSITTVNRELATLRTMFSFAVQNDWLPQNPFSRAKGIIVVAAEIARDRILTRDEEVRLIAACVDKRAHLRSILLCALDTAMRSGEMLQMRWRDVNLVTGEIVIPQTNTKTERSRVVGMTPRVRDELERLWKVSPQNPGDLVFGIRTSVKTAWRSACKKASVEDFHLHDCRHTATTRMIASGTPHSEVMKITGHSQMTTFLRYLNLTAETVATTASRLAEYLDGRESKEPDIESQHIN